MGILDRIKRRKYAKETANEILAYKYLAALCMVEYGVKLGHGENPVNYSHKVWRKNYKHIPDEEITQYHKEIEDFIASITKSTDYRALLNGNGSAELKLDTLIRYDYAVKNCGC